MAHGEKRGFLHQHVFVTEESTLLFWPKASKQPIPT